MDRDTRSALERILGDDVSFDEPMARHTALRVGGPAEGAGPPLRRASCAGGARRSRRHRGAGSTPPRSASATASR